MFFPILLSTALTRSLPTDTKAPAVAPSVIKFVSLLGKWEGKDGKGTHYELEFMKDQRLILKINDQTYGVSDYPVKYLQFGYDFSRKPALLGIYYIRRPITLLGEVTFIIQILSENQIILGKQVIDHRRTKDFDALPVAATLTLTREGTPGGPP